MATPSQSTQPFIPHRTEARLAAVDARAMAAQAAARCKVAAPDAEWLQAVPLRLPPVPGGVPPRPLILGVAALATANAAVALALDLVTAHGDAAAIGLTLTTASRLGIAAREGIYVMESGVVPGTANGSRTARPWPRTPRLMRWQRTRWPRARGGSITCRVPSTRFLVPGAELSTP